MPSGKLTGTEKQMICIILKWKWQLITQCIHKHTKAHKDKCPKIKPLMCLLNERRKQKKNNDCIELSFDNILLHKVILRIFQLAALIHNGIPN